MIAQSRSDTERGELMSSVRYIKGCYSLFLIGLIVMLSSGNVKGSVLSPHLERMVQQIDHVSADSTLEVLVFLDDSRTRSLSKSASMSFDRRSDRIKAVTRQLQSFKSPSADIVTKYIESVSGTILRKFWITPVYEIRIKASALATLANLRGVRLVVEDVALVYTKPVEVRASTSLVTSVSSQLQQLHVPALWQQGYTGTGRLVCSFDTGVESDHPALASKWRGNHASLSSSWFSKVAPLENPTDKAGHGSHTMGVMIGSSLGDTIGVAPGAEWITAGVIDQGRPLATTLADIVEAFQWALNPDGNVLTTDDVPDVILNSWGIPKGLFLPCDSTFNSVIANVESAGIVTIFAAGNEGPTSQSLRHPADLAMNRLSSFAVGAVDNNSVIATFSSRGPSSCDTTQIKPEVVAPGVLVRSSYKGGGYKTLSGTSMAAPYIAGLVALMRQYNPDATVEQIKNALISSATDLGPTGEDNAYGNGLVDASKLLSFLDPAVATPSFQITSIRTQEQGVTSPGQALDFWITLSNDSKFIGQADASVEIVSNTTITANIADAQFVFSSSASGAVNMLPFELAIPEGIVSGTQIDLLMTLSSSDGVVHDTTAFTITIGVESNGSFATHTSTQLSMTVSDFGQFGLADGSIYNLAGDGVKVHSGNNLLYEGGIIVSRNALQISSAVRADDGRFAQSDFRPIRSLSEPFSTADNGLHRTAVFTDNTSEIPIPVTVKQETISYPSLGDNGLVIFSYNIRNDALTVLTGLNFGTLLDFDLSSGNDTIVYDAQVGLMYQEAPGLPLVGYISLKNMNGIHTLENGLFKRGFTREQLHQFISSDFIDVSDQSRGDKLFIINGGQVDLDPGDSAQFAFALVGGSNLTELYANATAARMHFDIATDLDEGLSNLLPEDFILSQNYPNPFNPTTTISLQIPASGNVNLSIYNTLGQLVRVLNDAPLSAGPHQFEWDATDHYGNKVASGVYFYRMQAEEVTKTRKMLFVK